MSPTRTQSNRRFALTLVGRANESPRWVPKPAGHFLLARWTSVCIGWSTGLHGCRHGRAAYSKYVLLLNAPLGTRLNSGDVSGLASFVWATRFDLCTGTGLLEVRRTAAVRFKYSGKPQGRISPSHRASAASGTHTEVDTGRRLFASRQSGRSARGAEERTCSRYTDADRYRPRGLDARLAIGYRQHREKKNTGQRQPLRPGAHETRVIATNSRWMNGPSTGSTH